MRDDREDVPAAVRDLLPEATVEVAWRNAVGGVTFELETPSTRVFVKWAPVGSGVELADEALRLRWAAAYTRVPTVLAQGADDAGSWLMTAALPGDNAVAPRWLARPDRAVRALGAGLRALHDALPVAECPFSWQAAERVADTAARAGRDELQPGTWHREHAHLDVAAALDAVRVPPPIDRLVVCQGDACAPNTLLDEHGNVSGHVDLGELGVADRWADLAVATWSAEWNYGPGWTDPLLDAYGIAADPVRIAYYRLLWDLGP